MIPSVAATQLRSGIEDFLRSTFPVSTPKLHGLLHPLFERERGMVKGPYLSIDLPFEPSEIEGEPFPEIPLGFRPHRHQERAFRRLSGPSPRSTLVATGTGSGKTESFLWPILDHCRRHAGQPGIKALIIYPMNALATDQAKRIARTMARTPALKGLVKAGLFVGESERDPHRTMGPDMVITDKDTLRDSPPDILLTNYKMLDYLLIRPRDQKLWRGTGPETLRFLVVDELHTFDGAQGTDLACLIRRLRDRLSVPEGHLCCVGTSATLGSGADTAPLRTYASQVFAAEFDAGSVITEERQSVGKYLEEVLTDPRGIPRPSDAAALRPEGYASFEDYIRAQHRLWFDDEVPDNFSDSAWTVELGKERLQPLPFFQNLLKVLAGRARSIDDVLDELRQRIRLPKPPPGDSEGRYHRDLIDSIVALTAIARQWREESPEDRAAREAAGAPRPTRPFLNIHLQLWLRELRRMVADVTEKPALRFSDDLSEPELKVHLPVVHCLDCDSTGWTGLVRNGESTVQPDLKDFYNAFFAESRDVTFFFPTDGNAGAALGMRAGAHALLCGRCLHYAPNLNATKCSSCGCEDRLVPVFIPDNKDSVKHKDGKKFIGKHDCPYCGARSGLTILGSQAASLSSVMLGTLFASRYLEDADRKLIAFSDSVQDAAHRAGFFSARTYRLNFRTALQQAVRDAVGQSGAGSSGGGVALSGLAADFSRHWAAALGEEDYIATFLPADMAWLKEYEELRRDGTIQHGSELRELVDKRVAWEILSEYGLRARLGRTLERSGASVAHPDPALVEAAVADLLPGLTENIGCLRGLDPALLHRFLLGLIAHMRLQGAILHPFVEGYLADRGNSFLLGKALHMPRFGPRTRAPAFLLAGVVEHGRLERLLSPTGVRRTWCMAWTERCFGAMAQEIGAYLTDLYPRVLAALVRHGILGERMAGSDRAWGLLPEALLVTTDVAQLRCTVCRHEVSAAGAEAAAWDAAPCMRLHCSGHYQPSAEGGSDQGYYNALYGSGAVRRVVAQEHTGLLERDTREKLEHDFIHGTRRWHPNVLSATSTLEMGIDIGDLSTVLLCSVPPAQANYLQRIGRAGRRDGNALSVTVANGRPHDLYFFAEPEKMLAGAVDPPGVFLDASAILFRQFAGFTFDRWIATGVTEEALPVKLTQVLSHVEGKKETAFPYSWIGFVEARQTALLDDFVGLFKGELTADSVERLRAFVAGDEGAKFGLRWHVLDRLEALVKERASLKKQIQSLNTRIRRKEKEVPRDQNWEDDLAALRLEKNGFQQIVAQINDKDTLNFFTDEGLIPNYAFPEAGVTLRSIIYRKRREADEQGRKYETLPPFEYERPAASAISELAPSNHFYAEGRKVQIDQIDLSASEVEHWRLCRSCAHAEKVIGADPPPPCCPRCGDTLWNDGGRVQRMVRLRQVVATTSDRESRIGDDSDDREPAFYNRQMLVDFTDRNVQDAWCIDDPDFPFGFEFLTKAWFREINFGDRRREGPDMEVAGVMAQRSGFIICKHCGKVQRPKLRDGAGDGDKERVRRDHTLTCPTQNQESPDNFVETLYLYRELQSEAIRILLPVTSFAGSDRKLHSFIAAVNLGLKLKFRGSVDHLQTTVYDEPVAGTLHRKKYLILYDTVPGGTGYLKQLMESKEPLLEVFETALGTLRSCGCNQEPAPVDGCYRCLFAYRRSQDMKETSRDTAKDLLAEILKRRDRLKPTADGLKKVEVNGLFDSELEARFVEALRRASTDERPVTVTRQVVGNKSGYFLKIGERSWEIELQVPLGPADGVMVPVKPDFVFWPTRDRETVRPIAVFTDGYFYHSNRIGEDMLQRTAMVRSGRFRVMSLTWKDVENRFRSRSETGTNFLPLSVAKPMKGNVGGYMSSYRLEDMSRVPDEDSFSWLIRRLAVPNETAWAKLAFVRALLCVNMQFLSRN